MSDISDIKLNVEKIQKRFGGKTSIKTPGGEDEELDLILLLLQGMGTALFGTYKNNEGGIQNLFQNTGASLYSLVKDSKGFLENINNNTIKAIPNIKTDVAEIRKILSNNIDNLKNNQILDILNNIDQTLQNNINSENSGSFAIKGDTNSVEFINALNELLKNDEESFKKINDVLNSVTFDNFIQNIISLNSRFGNKDSINNLKININTLKTFIETISKISEINFNSLKDSDKKLLYIKNNLIDKIGDIIIEINKLSNASEKVNITSKIKVLQQIISVIPNIGSLNLKDLLWSRISINYLSYFIKDKIPLIFESLNSILDNNSNIGETVSKIDKCINSLISIFKLDTKELEDSEETIELINSLISNELNSVIKTLINIDDNNLENAIKKLENINKLISDIDDIQKMLPSIMSIFKSIIKLSFIQEEIDAISVILFPNELQEKYKIHIFKAKRNHFKEISKNLENFGEILKTLNKVNETISTIKIGDILKILTNVNTELVIVNKLFNKLTKLDKKYKTPLTFEGLRQTLNAFNDYAMSYIEDKFNNKIIDKINSISSFVGAVNSLIVILNNLDIELLESIDMSKFSDAIESKLKVLMISVDYVKNEDINEDIIKKIDILDKVITKIALLSNLKLLENVTEKSLDGILGVTNKLLEITNKFKQIKEDDVKGANKMLNSLMKLVIGTSAVLIFGTLIMNYINIASLLSFTLSLGLFITGILWVYSKITKEQLESSFASAKDLGLLIALSGAVLVFGSLFMKFVNIAELFGFTAALGLFIGGILWVYSIFSEKLKETFNSAFEFGLLIAISGGTLILGSLFYHFINWEDLVGFSLTLGVFMLGMLAIYALFNKSFKYALAGAKDFSILLATSAGLMILGGLIGDWINEHWDDILGFGLKLMAFTILIGAPWILGSLWFKNALKGAKEFAILITVSAAIMILGPALINLYGKELGGNYWERLGAIAVWGIALGGFVLLVGWALSLANKNGKSSILGALALSVAIGIAAAALIAGPILLCKSIGNDWPLHVLGFGVLLAGFIFGMTYLLKFVGKNIGNLALGAVGVVIIGAIAYGAAWVVKEISDMLFDVHWEDLLNGLGQMGLVFGAVGTVMGIIGGIMYAGGPIALLIAAGGAAVLATIEGLVWGAAKVINAIANSMKNLSVAAKIFKDNKNAEDIKNLIKTFGEVLESVCENIDISTAGKLTLIMPGVMMGIGALSMIGNVVKDWANMWVPDIDPKTGEKKGYRKLTNPEISAAIQNIRNVLTAIGNAIVEVTKDPNNKAIFGEGFLSGKSPFRVAMESFKYSGDILSGIAESIKSWSSMAIPVEFTKKGRPKRYTTLNDAELKNTQDNIRKVLVGIGSAICEVVNNDNNKKLFETGDRSPAMIAAKAIKESASALLDITKVIKEFSSKDFKTIIDKLNDPKNGALGNVNKVVSGIVNILKIFLDPYKENTRGTIAKWFVGEKTFVENLNDNRGEISKSAETVKIFCNNIESIFKSISDLGTNVSKNKEGLMFIADSSFATNMSNALGNLVKFTDDFLKLDQSDIGDVNKNKDMFDTYSKSVITIYKSIALIGDEIEKNRNGLRFVANKLLMTQLSLALNNLKDFTTGILGINQDDINKLNDKKDKFAVFKNFTELLNSFIESINKYDDQSQKGLMLLSQGIIVLYLSTQQIGQNILFKGFVNDTKDFVEKINSLDINKLYSMNNLINSMNELAQRLLNLGDLNELTETLANKVTAVLLELVNQLNHAERVINNAHKLQEKRKELIEKSVHKVKEIMKQNMIVKVGKLEESQLGTPSGGSTGGGTESGSGSSEGSTHELESPEEAPVNNKDKNDVSNLSKPTQKELYSEKPLTAEEFNRMMRDHMKGWTG